jgi:hypothetical protein
MFIILTNMHIPVCICTSSKGNGPDPKTGTGTGCKIVYCIQIFVTYAKPVNEQQFRIDKDPGPEIATLRYSLLFLGYFWVWCLSDLLSQLTLSYLIL